MIQALSPSKAQQPRFLDDANSNTRAEQNKTYISAPAHSREILPFSNLQWVSGDPPILEKAFCFTQTTAEYMSFLKTLTGALRNDEPNVWAVCNLAKLT